MIKQNIKANFRIMESQGPRILERYTRLPFVWPHVNVKVKQDQDSYWIWDSIRKSWLSFTGEEYVRQQLIHYLMDQRQISPGLIAIEKGIDYMGLPRRFDVVIYDRQAKPFILCECKAPHVKLSQETLEQIARYNTVLNAPHLLLTNGVSQLFFSLSESQEYLFQHSGWYQ